MLTRKYLRRTRRKIAAGGCDAVGWRNSARERLGLVARFSPDARERVAADVALSVLDAHGWRDSGFDELGISGRRGRPVTVPEAKSLGNAARSAGAGLALLGVP